jgi:hypothetical protein
VAIFAPIGEDQAPAEVTKARGAAPSQGVELRPLKRFDLVELARLGVQPPELVAGGHLYRGYVHSIAGPPDSGKTTLLDWWARKLLLAGEPVMYLDEEAGPELTIEKLLALGLQPDDLAGLHYYPFQGRTWDESDLAGLRVEIEDIKPVLLAADSLSALLAASDRDEDKARDVRRFIQRVLLEPAREYRHAAAYIDHVPKDERTSRYARGSGDKLAVVDVAYKVEPIKAFHRGQSGLFALKVTKDRRGYLHRQFEVRVQVDDECITLALERVEADAGGSELAGLPPAAVKILAVLRAAGQPLSNEAIGDGVKGRYGHGLSRPTISKGCAALVERSLADELEPRPGGPKYWTAT